MQDFVKYIVRAVLIFAWMVVIYFILMVPKFLEKKEELQKTIRVFTWANRIDETMIRKFEQESGIKVYLNYYESSEELLTKVEKTSALDCDIMLPSAHMIEKLVEKNLIKKIDKEKCSFIGTIAPEFLHAEFDSNNDYSIPIFWDVFGIGYNAKVVQDKPVTTQMLFDPKYMVGGEIGMTDDSRESIFLGAQYLKIPLTGHITDQALDNINELLQKQKPYVGAYSDTQQGYFLASDTFAVVVSDREIIARQMLNYDHIKFATLPEGSMMRLDSVVIHAETKKDEIIYKFLEFLFNYDVMMHHAKKYCILPTVKKVFDNLDKKYIGVPDLYPGSPIFKKLVMFKLDLTQKALNNFWIRFKAA